MNTYNGFTHRERARALRWLNAEYAAGRRKRPVVCDACGQTEGLIEAHSEDYSEPHGAHIGSFGFCLTCHLMVHCRFEAPARWEEYRTAIRAGAVFAPFTGRNWFGFRGRFLLAATLPEPLCYRARPTRLVLDNEIGVPR